MTGGWGTPSADAPSIGETFVNGKTRETAQGLLAACRALELPTLLVRTASAGFIVPNEVYEQFATDQASTHGI